MFGLTEMSVKIIMCDDIRILFFVHFLFCISLRFFLLRTANCDVLLESKQNENIMQGLKCSSNGIF